MNEDSSGGAAPRPRGPGHAPGGGAGPVQGIPGPVFVRWFGLFFVLVAVGVFIWGWMVAGGVRRMASETDNAMRTVAWEILRWSAGHDGRFPRSEGEFIDGMRNALAPPPPPPPSKPGDAAPWPADQKTALLGHPPALLPDALGRVKVLWPPRPDVAPEILADGKPSLPGTIEDVRGWLHAWVDAQRARLPPPHVAPPDSPSAAPPPSSAKLPS